MSKSILSCVFFSGTMRLQMWVGAELTLYLNQARRKLFRHAIEKRDPK